MLKHLSISRFAHFCNSSPFLYLVRENIGEIDLTDKMYKYKIKVYDEMLKLVIHTEPTGTNRNNLGMNHIWK